MTKTLFHTMPDGLRLAYRFHAGAEPALVFLPGYMSDMDGGKAGAVFQWAQDNDRACLLLDYSGCGLSEGNFADGTLSKWRGEVLALIAHVGLGQICLIGSSMGGWLNLLIGLELQDRLAGLVGIASAPDFTDWGRSAEDKQTLASGQVVFDDNPYGPDPTPMYPGFFNDGQSQRLLGSQIPIDCPVRLLHGQNDADVPWEISLKLAQALRSDDIQLVLIKDGDHRLSRDSDVALLLHAIATLPRH